MGIGRNSLATAMGISVVLAAIHAMKVSGDSGTAIGDAVRRFIVLDFSGLALFALLVTLAIVNVRNPEAHKRWMVLAMVPLLHAAMGRLFRAAFAPVGAKLPPPVL